MTRRLVGQVTIDSINQVGESIKLDRRTNGFLLGKRGSVFSLYAHSEDFDSLSDFRNKPSFEVSLETNGLLLSLNSANGKAEAINHDDVPPNAIFRYARREFDGTSASFCATSNGGEVWLRHSNSRLRFDNRNQGSSFPQDASFLVRPHRPLMNLNGTEIRERQPVKRPAPDGFVSSASETWSDTTPPTKHMKRDHGDTLLPTLEPIQPPAENSKSKTQTRCIWERINRIMALVKRNDERRALVANSDNYVTN